MVVVVEDGNEGAGDEPKAPKQEDTPLKSNLKLLIILDLMVWSFRDLLVKYLKITIIIVLSKFNVHQNAHH